MKFFLGLILLTAFGFVSAKQKVCPRNATKGGCNDPEWMFNTPFGCLSKYKELTIDDSYNYCVNTRQASFSIDIISSIVPQLKCLDISKHEREKYYILDGIFNSVMWTNMNGNGPISFADFPSFQPNSCKPNSVLAWHPRISKRHPMGELSCKHRSAKSSALCFKPVCATPKVQKADGTTACYFYKTGRFNYADAQAACHAIGARLPEIQSAAENAFIATSVVSPSGIWLGFSDAITEGTFLWDSTQKTGSYTNWNPGEPNNSGNEDCAEFLTANGKWNDIDCGGVKTQLVCEYVV